MQSRIFTSERFDLEIGDRLEDLGRDQVDAIVNIRQCLQSVEQSRTGGKDPRLPCRILIRRA